MMKTLKEYAAAFKETVGQEGFTPYVQAAFSAGFAAGVSATLNMLEEFKADTKATAIASAKAAKERHNSELLGSLELDGPKN